MTNDNNGKRANPLKNIGQFRRLFAYLTPYRGRIAIALLVVVVGSVLSLAGPYSLQFLVDSVFSHANAALLNQITLILVGIFLVQSLMYYIRGYLLSFVGERVMADLRISLFSHLQGLSLSFFNERRTGELVSRLTNDVATARTLVTTDVTNALSQALTFVGALVLIVVTDWRLTLFMFALIPVVFLFAAIFGRRLRTLSSAVQDQLASATTVMEEALGGVRVVKSFVREMYEIQRFSQSVEDAFRLAMKRVRLSALFGPLMSFMGFTAVVSIFWFGGREVLAGRLSAGQLVMFLALTFTIAGSIGTISSLWTNLQETLGATQRLFEILDTQTDIIEKPGAADAGDVFGNIRFEHVSFSYTDDLDSKILSDVNLEIQPGEVIALVGPSGAGKTTLVNLIPRFFDPQEGVVRLDGLDLRDLRVDSLRRNIGIVPQETLLFGSSVRENILYGRLDATQEEVEEAVRSANADEFIRQLPNGYDTLVGERGAKLSGGQRQRIAIARAILKNPRILLLDEATSSLDSESEGLVQEALERLMAGRTSVVIAHRLSTIHNADRIVVLDQGKVVEVGTHAELIVAGGLYAHLHRLQFRLEEPAVVKEEEKKPVKPVVRRSYSVLPGISDE